MIKALELFDNGRDTLQSKGWSSYSFKDGDIADIRTALTSQTWQGIESAPMEEKWILLSDGEEVFTGYWSRIFKAWRDMGDIGCNGWDEATPTHWMPLPLPSKDI